jgi:hypothetical protein
MELWIASASKLLTSSLSRRTDSTQLGSTLQYYMNGLIVARRANSNRVESIASQSRSTCISNNADNHKISLLHWNHMNFGQEIIDCRHCSLSNVEIWTVPTLDHFLPKAHVISMQERNGQASAFFITTMKQFWPKTHVIPMEASIVA